MVVLRAYWPTKRPLLVNCVMFYLKKTTFRKSVTGFYANSFPVYTWVCEIFTGKFAEIFYFVFKDLVSVVWVNRIEDLHHACHKMEIPGRTSRVKLSSETHYNNNLYSSI